MLLNETAAWDDNNFLLSRLCVVIMSIDSSVLCIRHWIKILVFLTPSYILMSLLYILLVLSSIMYILLCLICITGSTSETKPEEVKTLPGGKVKKKVYNQNQNSTLLILLQEFLVNITLGETRSYCWEGCSEQTKMCHNSQGFRDVWWE